MNANPATDTALFELVIERDADVTYAGYQYAAYWQTRRVQAGRYPVRVVTIKYTEPFTHNGPDQTMGKPYYAITDIPAVVVKGHEDLEKPGTEINHHVCAYHYQLTDGHPALYGTPVGETPATLPTPVGYFRKVVPGSDPQA